MRTSIAAAALAFGLGLCGVVKPALADYYSYQQNLKCKERYGRGAYWYGGRCHPPRPYYDQRRHRGGGRGWGRNCGPGSHYGCGAGGCYCFDDETGRAY